MKKKTLALAVLLCTALLLALTCAAAECKHNYVEQPGRVPATCWRTTLRRRRAPRPPARRPAR